MRGIGCLALALTMTGCATGPSLQSRMAAYIGSPGETLVRNLGVPDKQITLNGVQYLAYVREQTTVMAPPPLFVGYGGFGGFYGPYGPYGGGFYGPALAPTVTVWRCETTFTLQNDKVSGFTMRGNDCS